MATPRILCISLQMRWVRQSRMRKQSLRFLGSLLSLCELLVHGKSLIPSVKTSFNLHLALAFFLSHISWLQKGWSFEDNLSPQ